MLRAEGTAWGPAVDVGVAAPTGRIPERRSAIQVPDMHGWYWHGPAPYIRSVSAFSFEAVLFDLDGTLVATDRYWPDAARAASLRFFADEGIERPVPSGAEWMSMVGLPLGEGFADVLSDLEEDVRGRLMQACIDEEHALLARGQAALLGGVRETLVELKAKGVRLGIASNCGPDYLEVMMDGLGLGEWIEHGRCLGLPGIRTKSDMVEDLLQTFCTRNAVMVGDRPGDRDAAWANGIPHVHIPRGYGGLREDVAAEMVLDGMDQLVPALGGRGDLFREVASRLEGCQVIAVTGLPLAGRSTVAIEIVRQLLSAGVGALCVDGTALVPGAAGTFDSEAVRELDAEISAARARGAIAVADGGALQHRDLAGRFDAFVRVEAAEDMLVRRAQGLRFGPGPVMELREASLPLARALRAREVPADLTLDMTNALRPELRAPSNAR